MFIEFAILAVITIVGIMFILKARNNFSKDEYSKQAHTEVPTADEQGPSQKDKFQVKAMLKRSSKAEKKKKIEKTFEKNLENESESLPDPFAKD